MCRTLVAEAAAAAPAFREWRRRRRLLLLLLLLSLRPALAFLGPDLPLARRLSRRLQSNAVEPASEHARNGCRW